MIELGNKANLPNPEELVPVMIYGRPVKLPPLPSANHKVVCGFDQGVHVRLFRCETVADMQELYDAYYQGFAPRINWYIAPNDLIFIAPFEDQKNPPAEVQNEQETDRV